MRKNLWIIILNIIIVSIIFIGAFFYVNNENKNIENQNREKIYDLNLSMTQVESNYLAGEKNLCLSWANFINSHDMDMNSAMNFISSARTSYSDVIVQLIDKDTYIGKSSIYDDKTTFIDIDYSINSTTSNNKDFYDSNGNSNLFLFDDDAIHLTRRFNEPSTSENSVAFYTTVSLTDYKAAYLLRIVSINLLKSKWVFPKDEYKDTQMAIISKDGDYIVNDQVFSNTNFFSFYDEYNSDVLETLENKITTTDGIVDINVNGVKYTLSYATIKNNDNWIMLSIIESSSLKNQISDIFLLVLVGGGIFILFIIDLIVLFILNKRLQLAAKEASKANKAKTDFLSSMSHDIRTPMNAIVGLTTITEKNIDDSSLVKENLRKISLASNHLLTLINDILDISKVESGKIFLSPVNFSLVDCASNLVNISLPIVREKNIKFSFRCHNIDYENLYADELRLNQIFMNILSNAIKYTEPQGSVFVDIYEEKIDDNNVLLKYVVKDTGIGMSKEFMEKMYEPFIRQTDSRVNAIQGTGLGLTIIKRLVDLMQGEIDCESEVGKGTTFSVKLNIPIGKKMLDYNLNGINVLLVDDDEILLDTAKSTLKEMNANVDIAKTGDKAFSLIKEKYNGNDNYNIVILDWKMPNMSGIDLAKKIRDEIDKNIPILLISAYDWYDIEKDISNININGFIYKPLFKSKLYETINNLLGNSKLNDNSIETIPNYSDLSVLVAEDNDINYEIISQVLLMYGIISKRALNGSEAYNMVLNNEYFDLIFMDIQMPIMNGLDATKNIRKIDNDYAKNVLIVAMTADAFSENVQESLASGMNGHIAKPIDIKLVEKELKKAWNIKHNIK